MITVNSVFTQIANDIKENDIIYYAPNKTEDKENTFQNILTTIETANSLDTTLQLAAKQYGIPYNTIREKLSENGNIAENTKAFLYGIAVATSNTNTNPVNTVLNGITNTTASGAPLDLSLSSWH